MALRHRAFLLDKRQFRRKIAPMIPLLDKGEARLLFNMALSVIDETKPDVWVLGEAGSSLLDIRELDFVGISRSVPINEYLDQPGAVRPDDLGYWLLLVLSKYLEQCPGIGADYFVLDYALRDLGWSNHDRLLLFTGVSTSQLIKPGTVRRLIRKADDPYWYWMEPANAKSSGWLTTWQINRLFDRLTKDQEAIRNYEAQRFGNPWNVDTQVVAASQQDYLSRLHEANDRALAMLSVARERKKELYMVMSY